MKFVSISFLLLFICYIETASLDFNLSPTNENITIIPGTNGANSIQSYFNPLYSILFTPEIILKHVVMLDGVASKGINITFDPNTDKPNYKFPMKIKVNENITEGKYQVHIYGYWNTRLNFSKLTGIFENTGFKSLSNSRKSNEPKHVIVNLTIPPLLSIVYDKPNECTACESIKFIANFANNTSSTEYKFQKIGKFYNISTNWNINKSWIWVTNQSDIGNNTITVGVIDKCRANWNRTKTIFYLIKENRPPTVTINTRMGNYINATASDPDGDNISYMYEYKTSRDVTWTVARSWDKKTECTINVNPGKYIVRVSVKDDCHDPKEYSPNNATGDLIVSGGGDRENTGIRISESIEIGSNTKGNLETTSTSTTKPASNPTQKSTAQKNTETLIAIGIQSFTH